MLDFDLAALYDVDTKRLNGAVRRNPARFPEDFMFELSIDEFKILRTQIASSSWGGSRYPPFAFTEHGVAMLSSVLNSERSVQVNIAIVRAFIALRQYAHSFSELAAKVGELEKELADVNEVLHWLGDENQSRADEIAALQTTPKDWETRRPIGFQKE
ncbi:MAG: ORF6N domain-containing protein [Phycisphaerae bacterium]|nr:ORF6N domain-containing protein [Saprospiraceae bacterium]